MAANGKEETEVVNTNAMDEKKYTSVLTESIQLFADSIGFEKLDEHVLLLMSDDVNYRLRELIHNSSQYMRNADRRVVTHDDINKSQLCSDSEPLYGYSNGTKDIESIFVQDAGVFCPDDPEINLVQLANDIIEFKYHVNYEIVDRQADIEWLEVDGIKKNDSIEVVASSNGSTAPSTELMAYYDSLTKIILGDDDQLLDVALLYLSKSHKIQRILPYLINFLHVGIRQLSHNLDQLRKLLATIDALLKNQSLYLATYLTTIVNSVLYCILDPLTASINPINDHWALRDFAANLLAKILKLWRHSFIGRDIDTLIHKSLVATFSDLTQSLNSHYGSVTAFIALGHESTKIHLFPNIRDHWLHLVKYLDNSEYENAILKYDAEKVRGSLLNMSLFMCCKMRKDTFDESTNEEDCVNYLFIYNEFYDMLGDSLSAMLPTFIDQVRHRMYQKKLKSTEINLFGGTDCQKTGEELLDTFFETTHLEEEIISNVSGVGDDSYDENSASDNEKEPVDVDLQIKSTITDPSMGIKLTISKLRRSQPSSSSQSEDSSTPKRKKKRSDESVGPVFEEPIAKKFNKSIIIRISGCQSKTVGNGTPAKLAASSVSSSWYVASQKYRKFGTNLSWKTKLRSGKHFHRKLFSCEIFQTV